MRKIFTLLIVAILATATSWAAEPYKTALFGKDYNSKEVMVIQTLGAPLTQDLL